jgi:hypothetical protein
MTTYIIVFNMNNLGSLLSMTKRSYWQHPKKDFGDKTSKGASSLAGNDKAPGRTTGVWNRMRFWKKQKPRSGTVGGDTDV